MSRPRTLLADFIAPCLPTKTDKLPSGDLWLDEIKHDGFRVIARKDGDRVRLYSRPGNDITRRFPLIAETLTGLRSRRTFRWFDELLQQVTNLRLAHLNRRLSRESWLIAVQPISFMSRSSSVCIRPSARSTPACPAAAKG